MASARRAATRKVSAAARCSTRLPRSATAARAACDQRPTASRCRRAPSRRADADAARLRAREASAVRTHILMAATVACSSTCESFWSARCSCLRASVARVPLTTAHRCQLRIAARDATCAALPCPRASVAARALRLALVAAQCRSVERIVTSSTALHAATAARRHPAAETVALCHRRRAVAWASASALRKASAPWAARTRRRAASLSHCHSAHAVVAPMGERQSGAAARRVAAAAFALAAQIE